MAMWHVLSKMACCLLVLAAVGTLGGVTGEPEKMKYHIDGKVGDWKDMKPIWQDAGRSKASFPQEFDVKEVYLDNDDRYLYAFLHVKPSLPERFGRENSTGNIGYFYFDTDDNPIQVPRRFGA